MTIYLFLNWHNLQIISDVTIHLQIDSIYDYFPVNFFDGTQSIWGQLQICINMVNRSPQNFMLLSEIYKAIVFQYDQYQKNKLNKQMLSIVLYNPYHADKTITEKLSSQTGLIILQE